MLLIIMFPVLHLIWDEFTGFFLKINKKHFTFLEVRTDRKTFTAIFHNKLSKIMGIFQVSYYDNCSSTIFFSGLLLYEINRSSIILVVSVIAP